MCVGLDIEHAESAVAGNEGVVRLVEAGGLQLEPNDTVCAAVRRVGAVLT